ncbi:MAG: hypothetical protein M1834_007702 [Cirrosporium novae-zelandiae]|nr:MAG: hypothetical protein M1834_007702 [Cirrosporium novae-zelandiae]
MSSEIDFDLDSALDSLPSCLRCRRQRRRCDRLLPSCQKCLDAHAECETWDHILEETFPRSYIYTLHQRLRALNEILALDDQQEKTKPDPVNEFVGANDGLKLPDENSSNPYGGILTTNPPDALIVPKGVNNDINRVFWGYSSAFAYLNIYLSSIKSTPEAPTQHLSGTGFFQDLDLLVFLKRQKQAQSPDLPPLSVARHLIEIYYLSIETLTPILGKILIIKDVNLVYGLNDTETGNEIGYKFSSRLRIQLVLAIAMRIAASSRQEVPQHTTSRHDTRRKLLEASEGLFDAATSCLDLGFSGGTFALSSGLPAQEDDDCDPDLSKLRIILLLIVYVFFSPEKGNAWRLLGFAGRLRPKQVLSCTQGHQLTRKNCTACGLQIQQRAKFETIYRSLECYEVIVSIAYGRPISIVEANDHVLYDIRGPMIHTYFMVETRHESLLSFRRWSLSWFKEMETLADSWLHHWDFILSNGGSRDAPIFKSDIKELDNVVEDDLTAYLSTVGRIMRDEVIHSALCFLLQASLVQFPNSSPSSEASPSESGIEDILEVGPEVVRSLIVGYWNLYSTPRFRRFHHDHFQDTAGNSPNQQPEKDDGLQQDRHYEVELILPGNWTFALEVLRAAVTSLWYLRRLPQTPMTEETEGGSQRITLERVLRANVETCMALLGKITTRQEGNWTGAIQAIRSLL